MSGIKGPARKIGLRNYGEHAVINAFGIMFVSGRLHLVTARQYFQCM
jgi:hypothetical protein